MYSNKNAKKMENWKLAAGKQMSSINRLSILFYVNNIRMDAEVSLYAYHFGINFRTTYPWNIAWSKMLVAKYHVIKNMQCTACII